MTRTRSWTIEQLKEAVASSITLSETLRKIGLSEAGGNRDHIKHHIKLENIDTSHFSRNFPNPRPATQTRKLQEILVNGSKVSTDSLKKRLIRNGLKKHICENCKRTSWLKKLIPLELHHVDGDKYNNSIENIQLLCPNCHALTSNYRGKNIKR